jgi:Methylamine utilization protein MauJ
MGSMYSVHSHLMVRLKGMELSKRKRPRKQKRKKATRQWPASKNQRANAGGSGKIQIERPETNERHQFISVPEFAPDDPRSLIPRSPQGTAGFYRVMFALGIPGKELFFDDQDLNILRNSGISLLLMPPGAAFANVKLIEASNERERETVEVQLASGDGRVANAQIRVHASSFTEAEHYAFDLVMPILSRLSFEYDVALDVKFYEVVEEQTDVYKWTFGIVGKTKLLGTNLRGLSKPEFRMVFAAYREAANATNPFYQLLCFYKVIEGVKKLRAKRKEALLTAGSEYREPPDERMPTSDADLNIVSSLHREFFQPYLGQKFTRVLDQFRNLLRNAVAHLDPMGDSLIIDDFEDVAQCERTVPVIKYICRVMLQNELQADPNLQFVQVS